MRESCRHVSGFFVGFLLNVGRFWGYNWGYSKGKIGNGRFCP